MRAGDPRSGAIVCSNVNRRPAPPTSPNTISLSSRNPPLLYPFPTNFMLLINTRSTVVRDLPSKTYPYTYATTTLRQRLTTPRRSHDNGGEPTPKNHKLLSRPEINHKLSEISHKLLPRSAIAKGQHRPTERKSPHRTGCTYLTEPPVLHSTFLFRRPK